MISILFKVQQDNNRLLEKRKVIFKTVEAEDGTLDVTVENYMHFPYLTEEKRSWRMKKQNKESIMNKLEKLLM